MDILRQARDWGGTPRKTCAAIGMFDGVHLGHQQVIRQTILDARQRNASAIVVTFDRHPSSVVAPSRTPPLIYSLPQKLRAIEALGADAVLLIEFTPEFSRVTAENFIRGLSGDLGRMLAVCVGSNFAFGHKRGGDVTLLTRLGEQLGFAVHGLPAVSLGGRVVSSTRIREAVAAGDLDAASQMLGRPYSVSGIVAEGDKLGRKLGIPTANVDVAGLALPPRGVYAAQATFRGKTCPAALNIGVRPTIGTTEPQLRFEVHLLDAREDLYGQELETTPLRLVRPERKFDSLEALRSQIEKDIAAVRELLG